MVKNDYLIMLIGSSPMPNLISACTRIKENGKIFMIYTEETKNIANQLKRLLEEKSLNKEMNICVDLTLGKICEEYNLEKVSSYLENIFNKIKNKYLDENITGKSIELNFTGGTKIMSSASYRIFKEKFKNENAYLTYLDSEESEVVIYDINKEKTEKVSYSNEYETISIDIEDIINMHFDLINNGNKFQIERYEECRISKVNEYIYESFIENFNKNKEFISLMEKFYSFHESYNTRKKFMSNINKIDSDIENSSFKIKNINNYSDIINIYKEEFEHLKEKDLFTLIKDDITGKWLEKVLLKKLKKLKDNGYIDDVRISVARKNKNKKDNQIFEIDFLILKKERLYCISVTTVDNYDEANMKLHEISYRAKSIGGEGVKIGFISFFENNKQLEDKVCEVWDDYNSLRSKYLIITLENFTQLDSELIQWLK